MHPCHERPGPHQWAGVRPKDRFRQPVPLRGIELNAVQSTDEVLLHAPSGARQHGIQVAKAQPTDMIEGGHLVHGRQAAQ